MTDEQDQFTRLLYNLPHGICDGILWSFPERTPPGYRYIDEDLRVDAIGALLACFYAIEIDQEEDMNIVQIVAIHRSKYKSLFWNILNLPQLVIGKSTVQSATVSFDNITGTVLKIVFVCDDSSSASCLFASPPIASSAISDIESDTLISRSVSLMASKDTSQKSFSFDVSVTDLAIRSNRSWLPIHAELDQETAQAKLEYDAMRHSLKIFHYSAETSRLDQPYVSVSDEWVEGLGLIGDSSSVTRIPSSSLKPSSQLVLDIGSRFHLVRALINPSLILGVIYFHEAEEINISNRSAIRLRGWRRQARPDGAQATGIINSTNLHLPHDEVEVELDVDRDLGIILSITQFIPDQEPFVVRLLPRFSSNVSSFS